MRAGGLLGLRAGGSPAELPLVAGGGVRLTTAGVRMVLVDGKEVTLAALARTFGVLPDTARARAAKGWPLWRIFGPSQN